MEIGGSKCMGKNPKIKKKKRTEEKRRKKDWKEKRGCKGGRKERGNKNNSNSGMMAVKDTGMYR